MNLYFWIGLITGSIFSWTYFIEIIKTKAIEKPFFNLLFSLESSMSGFMVGVLLSIIFSILIKIFAPQILAFLDWLQKISKSNM